MADNRKLKRTEETSAVLEAGRHMLMAHYDMPMAHLLTDDFALTEKIVYESSLASVIDPELAKKQKMIKKRQGDLDSRSEENQAAGRFVSVHTIPGASGLSRVDAREEWYHNKSGMKIVFYFNGSGTRTRELSQKEISLLWDYLEAWHRGEVKDCYVIFYGKDLILPSGMEDYIERVEIPPLTEEDFSKIIHRFMREEIKENGNASLLKSEIEWYSRQMGGFDESMVGRVLKRIAHSNGGTICVESEHEQEAAERIIRDAKMQRLLRRGKLICEPVDCEDSAPVRIEEWLDHHIEVLRNLDMNQKAPNGMLLAGVPGTGKSMTAKAVARKLKLPLVRLEIGRILGGLVGDSEHNMEQALSDLEFLSPCVLWVDELEKAFGGTGNGGDSGVMTRLVGQLLTFLQESKRKVFLVATANDIHGLPPEMLRNGRIDVRFALLMPTYSECLQIMERKLEKCLPGLLKQERKLLANDLLSECVGTYKEPHFLIGADIALLTEELMWRWNSKEDFVRVMREKVVPNVRVYGDTRYGENMEHIGECYLKLLPQAMLAAGKEEELLFDPIHYHPEQITEFFFEREEQMPGNLPHCITPPSWLRTDCDRNDPEEWYDVRLFESIRDAMDRILLKEVRSEVFVSYMRCKKKYRK